jgi:hypothetical protein
MKWELGALKILARNETVPGIALRDAIGEIERLQKKADYLTDSVKRLRGLEDGTHYRCTGCDEIYELPPASTVGITEDHTARFCRECTEDGEEKE